MPPPPKYTLQLVYSDTWQCSYMEWQKPEHKLGGRLPSAQFLPSVVTLNPAKDFPAPYKLPTSVEAIKSGLGTLLRPSLEKHYPSFIHIPDSGRACTRIRVVWRFQVLRSP